MLTKFTTFSLLLILTIFSAGTSFSQDRKVVKNTVLDGSEIGTRNLNKSVKNTTDNNLQPMTTAGGLTVTYSTFGLSSYYDLQSNSTTNEVWQDPNNADYVHSAVMVLPVFGGTRVVNYVLSTDRGVTWTNFGSIDVAASGFPSIDGLSDGSAIVTMHTSAGGVGTRSQVFTDLGPGFGSWSRFDPGTSGANSLIWGRVVATQSISSTIKWVLTSSQNATDGEVATITQSDLAPPGTFSPWNPYLSDNAEQYCLARGEDGRIGNAFISQGAVNLGDVEFRESMDGGLTWSTPIKIYDANPAVDTLGAFRGLSMVYLGNTPCVTFEVDYITETGFFPTLPSSIYCWNPTVNSGIPVMVANQSNVTFYPNNGVENGVMTPICRPAIGKVNGNSNNNVLFIAMNVATAEMAADSNTYYAIYFSTSYDNGATWTTPERITPASPLMDYRYVSISRTNAVVGDGCEVQLVVETKNYAGAFAPNEPPGPADFTSVKVLVPLTSINEISSTVPSDYSLKQNYPNPFNPSTSIRFDIQKGSNVSLEVYNIKGQKVATLINNEFVSPGTKEVSFNASNLTSGIYYYTLSTGNFTDTKKMMLIK
ncbi:MAG: T9SS type A sorting domain-containing protein [Ignavibacteriae bacterium]|nr:T9SS type A sorting domain-containing protein [Ignavibacteriota bacterium]